MATKYPRSQPAQTQAKQPGKQTQMDPEPISMREGYRGSDKLKGKVAVISGGDSGIGRAVALHFAAEGAKVAIVYLNETKDAEKTKELVESLVWHSADGAGFGLEARHEAENGTKGGAKRKGSQKGSGSDTGNVETGKGSGNGSGGPGIRLDLEEASKPSCMLIKGDLGDEKFCKQVIRDVIKEYGQLDILVNNAAEQHPQESLEDITTKQIEATFRTNVFSYLYLTKAALEHMESGGCIVNTTSVTAYRGSPELIDYSATKGAIVAFTRSLSENLAERGIRVNAVAPGPIWTPLIPATFDADKVGEFGSDTPMGRAGQPAEVAPAYVFLASEDSSYMTGQVLHPNGGEIIGG